MVVLLPRSEKGAESIDEDASLDVMDAMSVEVDSDDKDT